MCPLEQGRTSECIPALSENLGMYSWIERYETDGQTDHWRFAIRGKIALGAQLFLKLPIAHVLSVTGPAEREPRMCSDEQGEYCSKRAKKPPRQEPWGCILGSDNMETDRAFEIVNLRKNCAWGAIFPQIDVCSLQSSSGASGGASGGA